MSRQRLRGGWGRLQQRLRWAARQFVLQLYPRAWRRRYAAEFTALLSHRRLTLPEILDVLYAALDAQRRSRANVPEHGNGWDFSADETPARCVGYADCPYRDDGRERSMARRTRQFECSFCGKNQAQVRRLIAGPNGVYICDACVGLCNEIIAEGEAETEHETPGQRSEEALPTQGLSIIRWSDDFRRYASRAQKLLVGVGSANINAASWLLRAGSRELKGPGGRPDGLAVWRSMGLRCPPRDCLQ